MPKKSKRKSSDIIPLYDTFPLTDTAYIEPSTRRRIPTWEAVHMLRKWSKENKQ